MNLHNEFREYAIKHMGITPMEFYQWEQIQERLYGANASLTPYILEEREMRVTQLDIFSRMMMDWPSKRQNEHGGSSTAYVFG